MRNLPEFIFTFFAAHLLGAVPAMVNAWLPQEQILHCLKLADPRVVVVDGERVGALILSEESGKSMRIGREEALRRLREKMPELVDVFVARDENVRHPFTSLSQVTSPHNPNSPTLPTPSVLPSPSSPCTLFFTSGTTGLPKAVLSSQRGFLGNTFGLFAGKARAVLREGGNLRDVWGMGEGWVDGRKVNEDGTGAQAEEEEQKSALLAVPLFHVTGMTSTVVRCIFNLITMEVYLRT